MTTLKFPPNDEFMSFCRTEGFPNNYNDCLKATLQNDLGSSNPSIGDLMRAHFDRFQDDDYFSITNEAFRIIKSYGTDAHVYLPGIGVINGLTAGNYLDSAGTTAATVDNPVGLVLDAANSVLGNELVTNGTFDTDTTGWTGSTLTVEAGKIKILGGNANQSFATIIGKTYRLLVDFTYFNSGGVFIGSTSGGSQNYSENAISASKQVSAVFVATATTTYIRLWSWEGTGKYCFYDNISVREVTGIHAIQATTANKPVLRLSGGRYYFDFVDGTDVLNATYPAGWESVTTIDAAPTGQATLTAQNIVGTYAITTDTYGRFVFKTITASELAIIQSFANRLAGVQPSQVSDLFSAGEQGAWYDPSDFSTMFQDAAGTTPVTAVGQAVGRILDKSGRGNHATQTTNTKRPVLQQDANGKYYLLFDGIDDALQTASVNFTGTDKVTVWAGVRKLNATGVFSPLLRLGSTADTTNGFYLAAPSGIRDYLFNSYITIQQTAFAAIGSYPPPHTAVLTGITDVYAPLVKLRVNGNQFENINTAGQGIGSFTNKSLYIANDAGSSYFNGRLYSLIIRGAQSSDTQISNAEAYVNSRTGAY